MSTSLALCIIKQAVVEISTKFIIQKTLSQFFGFDCMLEQLVILSNKHNTVITKRPIQLEFMKMVNWMHKIILFFTCQWYTPGTHYACLLATAFISIYVELKSNCIMSLQKQLD